jgi:hypothetical protein
MEMENYNNLNAINPPQPTPIDMIGKKRPAVEWIVRVIF